jgi:hypothetical protein
MLASCQSVRAGMPDSLRAKMAPRFRFASGFQWLASAMAGAVLAILAVVPIVRAQSGQPQWFQFSFGPSASAPASDAQKAGYDSILMFGDEHPIGAHFAITKIDDNTVRLAIHAKQYPPGPLSSTQVNLDLAGYDFSYTPGAALRVPVEGGGTLFLRGEIKDHQPKFAFGNSTEPSPDELVLSCPVLIRGDAVVANVDCGSTHIRVGQTAIIGTAEGQGRFLFAIEPFPGAVEGQAEWGRLKFTIKGAEYQLVGASPLTGGEQPRTVWVRRDDSAISDGKQAFIGSGPISSFAAMK